MIRPFAAVLCTTAAFALFAVPASQVQADELFPSLFGGARKSAPQQNYPVLENRYIKQYCGPHIPACGPCFGFHRTKWRSWEEACGEPTPPVYGPVTALPAVPLSEPEKATDDKTKDDKAKDAKKPSDTEKPKSPPKTTELPLPPLVPPTTTLPIPKTTDKNPAPASLGMTSGTDKPAIMTIPISTISITAPEVPSNMKIVPPSAGPISPPELIFPPSGK